MNKKINLSYILTTYNKLPYLRISLNYLLENLKDDEEIVVTDGASTDGTYDYLNELYHHGKIHQFLSEPDLGEAHGFNKALLMAKGELIKIISDDDVFFYPGIQDSKHFLLNNKHIEVISSSGGTCFLNDTANITSFESKYIARFKKWQSDKIPFEFSGLGIMFRKDAISKIGLFRIGIVWVDYEFTYRATSCTNNIAWHTGNHWVHLGNLHSNSRNFKNRMNEEAIKFDFIYQNIPPDKNKRRKPGNNLIFINQLTKKFKKIIKKVLYRLIFKSKTLIKPARKEEELETIISRAYTEANSWLIRNNQDSPGQILV